MKSARCLRRTWAVQQASKPALLRVWVRLPQPQPDHRPRWMLQRDRCGTGIRPPQMVLPRWMPGGTRGDMPVKGWPSPGPAVASNRGVTVVRTTRCADHAATSTATLTTCGNTRHRTEVRSDVSGHTRWPIATHRRLETVLGQARSGTSIGSRGFRPQGSGDTTRMRAGAHCMLRSPDPPRNRCAAGCSRCRWTCGGPIQSRCGGERAAAAVMRVKGVLTCLAGTRGLGQQPRVGHQDQLKAHRTPGAVESHARQRTQAPPTRDAAEYLLQAVVGIAHPQALAVTESTACVRRRGRAMLGTTRGSHRHATKWTIDPNGHRSLSTFRMMLLAERVALGLHLRTACHQPQARTKGLRRGRCDLVQTVGTARGRYPPGGTWAAVPAMVAAWATASGFRLGATPRAIGTCSFKAVLGRMVRPICGRRTLLSTHLLQACATCPTCQTLERRSIQRMTRPPVTRTTWSHPLSPLRRPVTVLMMSSRLPWMTPMNWKHTPRR
mmetsp:Transcript_35544/g.92941  ORF Transcript_35544/g.92941 Transcript_35544/m.92941 type:complete len:495 (+) Transcript_35544:489-1973(+)